MYLKVVVLIRTKSFYLFLHTEPELVYYIVNYF